MHCDLETTAEANKRTMLFPNALIPHDHLPQREQARKNRGTPPQERSQLLTSLTTLILRSLLDLLRSDLFIIQDNWRKAILKEKA
jgi:hypothetical protein